MLQSSSRFVFIALVIILIVLPVISQETISQLDMTLTASMSATATVTPSSTPEITPEVTMEVSPSPTATITIEASAEITEIPAEVTAPAESTESAEITEAVEVTEEVLSPTEAPATEILATATLGTIPMEVLNGSVQYQSRTEHSGIVIQIFTQDNRLLSAAETNSKGIFSVAVPAEENYIVLVQAPLHRSIRLIAEAGIGLPPLVMAGGDLNGDGCINYADMDTLLASYDRANTPETDINADGKSDLSDLAILTGNFDADCGIVAESTEAVE